MGYRYEDCDRVGMAAGVMIALIGIALGLQFDSQSFPYSIIEGLCLGTLVG